MQVSEASRVLVSPLNWGIGHATRSIPLITFLLEQEMEVELAASGRAYAVLAEQFPQLKLHRAPSFEVQYGSDSRSTAWCLFKSSLGLRKQVRREQAWLKEHFPAAYFRGVISDNGYGMYIPGAQNVLITHQLQLHSGMGAWVDTFLDKQVRLLTTPFQEIWIPDWEDESESLAGKLSHPRTPTKQTSVYLGPLSRLNPVNNSHPQTILFLISGPEPQRTIFEQIALEVAESLSSPVVVVGGNIQSPLIESPRIEKDKSRSGHRVFLAYANQEKLSELLSSSDLVVARSGYSSVMDMVRFGRKAVWVPTPGQGEQQYLASYLSSKHPYFAQASQTVESISAAIDSLALVSGPQPIHSNRYEEPIRNWCHALKRLES